MTDSEPTASRLAIRVWDAPTRVFHWLNALCFLGAYLTAESERWRLVHVTLGYTMGGLLLFRLVWGWVGTTYARFAQFVRGPRHMVRYAVSIVRGTPADFLGHNPLGAAAILVMLAVGGFLVFSGWASYNDWGPNAISDWHARAAQILLAAVALHIAGVLLASWQHRENLIVAMVTGTKYAQGGTGIARGLRGIALVMVVLVMAFWAYQWWWAP